MPRINFFSDEPERKGDAASEDMNDDLFAGMHKLDLFADEAERPAAPQSSGTAPAVSASSEDDDHIGARVFRSLFAQEETASSQPTPQTHVQAFDFETKNTPIRPAEPCADAQAESKTVFGEDFAFEVPVPGQAASHTAQQSAAAGQTPANTFFGETSLDTSFDASPLGAAGGAASSFTPVFSPTAPRRTGRAKPIDWKANMLEPRTPAAAPEAPAAEQAAAPEAAADVQPQAEAALQAAPVVPQPTPNEHVAAPEAAQAVPESVDTAANPLANEQPTAPFAQTFGFDAPAAAQPAAPSAKEPELFGARAFDFDAPFEEPASTSTSTPAPVQTPASTAFSGRAFDFDAPFEEPVSAAPAQAPAAETAAVPFNFEALRETVEAAPAMPTAPAAVETTASAEAKPSPTEQPSAPQESAPWGQVFDQVRAGRTEEPSDDQEGSTRVFSPSFAHSIFEDDELRKPTVFDFDAPYENAPAEAAPAATPSTAAPTAASAVFQVDTPAPIADTASNVRQSAPEVPLAPASADQAPSTFGSPFDFDQIDFGEEPRQEEPTRAPQNIAENIFAGLYDGDPDEDDDEEDVRPHRGSGRGGNGGGRNGGNGGSGGHYSAPRTGDETGSKLPLIIGVAVVVFILIALLVYNLLFKKADKVTSSSYSASVSDSSDIAAGDTTGAEDEVTVVEVIPRDEWYMKLVNRDNVLSADYTIDQGSVDGVVVDARIVEPLTQMIEAAQADGVSLQVVAGYRSYSRQASAYTAGTTDVPAGASEHNLGLSVDIMTPSETSYNISAFEATAAYQWLRDNAANYGFILRYPEDATAITGFNYEPWHYRYVGVDQAQKIVASGLTLEQYLAQDIPTGIPG